MCELEDVPSRELSEWIAYQRVRGPISPLRADALASMIVQAVYATVMPKGKKPPAIDKIMPKWGGSGDEKSEPLTPEEERAAIMRRLGAVAPKTKGTPDTK